MNVQQDDRLVHREDLGHLVIHLKTEGYRVWIGATCDHVLAHEELGGLVDAGLIDREDLEGAELAFEAGFEEVPYDSPLWGDEGTWAQLMIEASLPPVSGGAPRFEPTAADWDDYRRDSEARGADEAPRYGYE